MAELPAEILFTMYVHFLLITFVKHCRSINSNPYIFRNIAIKLHERSPLKLSIGIIISPLIRHPVGQKYQKNVEQFSNIRVIYDGGVRQRGGRANLN